MDSTTTQAGEPLTPLWTDEDIHNDVKRASSNPTEQAKIRACLLFMRHGYEAERATLTRQLGEAQAVLNALREYVTADEWSDAHRSVEFGDTNDEQ